MEDGSKTVARQLNKSRDMDVHETVESLIQQAESFHAGATSVEWDYNDAWSVKIVVKKKKKK